MTPGVDTIEPMVVRSPLAWDPAPPPPKRHWLWILVPAAICSGVLIASFNLILPYYALAPGSARPVGKLIELPQEERHPPQGDVLLTTISLYEVRPFDALVAWIRDDIEVVEREKILPPRTSDAEYRRQNLDVMGDSKQTAIAVALRRLGYNLTEQGDGALVEIVYPDLPAEKALHQGDTIVAIDGKPVKVDGDAVAAIRAHKPGEVVRVELQPADGGANRVVEIPTAIDPQRGNAIIGANLRTRNRRFDQPFPIDIDSSDIGGPSAGLAFTLGVIDSLTPGELTGGQKVAATGTIELDGRVGDVGAVAQKTSAVERSGAKVFLVPAGEYEVAKKHAAKDLRVIPVRTLDDAITALQSIGGDVSTLPPKPES